MTTRRYAIRNLKDHHIEVFPAYSRGGYSSVLERKLERGYYLYLKLVDENDLNPHMKDYKTELICPCKRKCKSLTRKAFNLIEQNRNNIILKYFSEYDIDLDNYKESLI